MAFIGKYRYTLDDKSRVKFPVSFREQLELPAVMTLGVGNRLNIYPSKMLLEYFPTVQKPNLWDEKAMDNSTNFFENMQYLDFDPQGRIIINNNALRERFDGSKEVVFIGKYNYIEVWPAQAFDSRQELLDPAHIAEMLKSLSGVLDESENK